MEDKNKKLPAMEKAAVESVLKAGGEMGELMRSIDWSQTPVGPVSTWPQSLKTTVRLILNSKFGMFLWWGPDLIQFYNDAYRPSFGKSGEKHPQAMGQKGKDCWQEIWHIIYPQIEQVMTTGIATMNVNQLVPIYRNNILEEVYWTYTYSPVFDDNGDVGGVLVVETETTKQVIGERRTTLLRDLAIKLNNAWNRAEACKMATEALSGDTRDISFSLLYLINDSKDRMELACYSGLEQHPQARPEYIEEQQSNYQEAWSAVRSGVSECIDDLSKRFGALPGGAWPENTTSACVLPLILHNHPQGIGVFIAGLSPRIISDEDYTNFLESVARLISSGIVTTKAHEDEKERLETLEQLDKAKTIFFSNVSHEFRTPLTLMLGPLQEILSSSLKNENEDLLKMVYENGLRLQKLVNSLLDFSRIEAGRIDAFYSPTDLALLTVELTSNFRSAIEKAGMKLNIDIPPLSEPVYVDSEMWEKIILNLLSNAFKYTLQGEISVCLMENESNVVLEVSDTGEGIDADEIENIFDRFKRVEGAKARSHEGSGIGLALVKELVRLHGGFIDVKSKKGKGTLFTVVIPKGVSHLPESQISNKNERYRHSDVESYIKEVRQWLHNEISEDPDPPTAPGQGDASKKPLILLADDNADMRRYISRLLSGNFEVEAVANGKIALESLHKRLPDLIITDIMMPEMDGFEFFKAVKSKLKTSTIPFMMLTAKAGEAAKIAGLKTGVDSYLEKPFNSNEFITRVTTLIESRRAKRETEENLYTLLMDAPAFIALLNGPSLVFELCNHRYRDLVGKNRDIIGKPALEALPEIKEQGFITILQNVFDTGIPFVGNEIKARLDKFGTGELHEVYLNFLYHPILDAEGNTKSIFVHGVDITDQVLARKKIEEAEGRLIAIINQATAGIAQADLNGRFILVNDRFCEITRYSRNELLGMKMEDIVHPDDAEIHSSTYDTLMHSGIKLKLEKRCITKNKDEIWVSDNVSLIVDNDGEPSSILSVMLDITEQKKAQEALRESEENFRTLADNIPNLCWMADSNGWIYWYNSRWYEYTGTKPEDMLGWGWQSVHDPVILEQVLLKYNESIKSGSAFEMVFPLRSATGEFRPFLTRMTPVMDENGNVVQWFGTNTDITERENLARQKDEFLSIASHELKTPVTSIKAYTQVLLSRFQEVNDELTVGMLSKMDGQLNKLTSLISDLLDVTKIEQGKLKFKEEEFDFSELVLETVEEVQRTTKKHTIEVRLNKTEKVKADRDRIGQVITNFLTNAIKYSPKNETIIVTTDLREDELFLSVKDYGIGLSKEDCYNVFNRFYRVEGSGFETFPGLGLGLYISSEIIHRHYGEIWAESEKGNGSIFYFTLPIGKN